jgi:hypothetical protein
MPKGPTPADPKHRGKGRGGGVEDGTIAVLAGFSRPYRIVVLCARLPIRCMPESLT